MRKTKKLATILLTLIFLLQPMQNAFAHPELTNVLYSDTDTGWVIKEYSFGSHNNNTNFTYRYDDATFTNTTDASGVQASTYLYTAFTDGISKWTSRLSVLSFTESASSPYIVSAEYREDTSTIAYWRGDAYTNVGGDSNHRHHASGVIVMNAAQMPSTRTANPVTMAHEVGHMIGLHDVYVRNDILMYGYSGGTATGPTIYDINGAKVVTGLHGNNDHTFTTQQDNYSYHKKICSICDGYQRENHNPIEVGYYIGSTGHQINCSECGLVIINQCTLPFKSSSITQVTSENLCRIITYSCANGHSFTYNDTIHLLDSNNKCIDCGYSGTSWCFPFTHNWSVVSEVLLSTQNQCYKALKVCSKCHQNKEETISAHDFNDGCTTINCKKCNWAREAPNHDIMVEIVYPATSGVCREFYDKCNNCTFRLLVNTDTTHTYGSWSSNTALNKCERACSTCGYVSTKAHSYDYSCDEECNDCKAIRTTTIGHIFNDCLDTDCNKCSNIRTAPGHSYNYGSWIDVTTAGTCEKRLLSCKNCSYSYYVYDYIHAYTDCSDSTCNDCGYTRAAPGHTFTYGVWTDVATEGTCEKRLINCNNCTYLYYVYDYDHAYSGCTDSVCNDCSYTRTAPGHSYTYGPWTDVATEGTCEKRLLSCNNCTYSYYAYDYTHAYTDCTDSTCNDCTYTRTAPGHSYSYGAWTDVTTTGTCEKRLVSCNNCSYSYYVYDYSHAYSDCTDSICNDCSYTRTAPGHSYTYGAWTDVATSGTCEKRLISCNNCLYSYYVYDYSHAYSDCIDSVCNDCSYNRTAPGHSYTYGAWTDVATSGTCEKRLVSCNNCSYSYYVYDYSHIYSDCTDSICNDCSYTRTAPGHSYTYGAWTDVATSGTCEKRLVSCNNCSYSYYVYDYSHIYSDCTDSICNDCSYSRSAPGHSYTYGAWTDVATSGTCEKRLVSCTKCSYSYYSYDYSHIYSSSTDKTCNDCGYVR